ncbi:MAG: DUF4340 domain-containing protein [Henriciella sp.]|nr:DUF4340 domain-containing protein [Henriciella sp.]
MSALLDQKRRARVIRLAVVAVVLWLVVFASGWLAPSGTSSHARLGEPVLPGFAETRREAQRIRFSMADDAYTILRTESGWVMEESGNYPIRPDRLSELATGLENLTLDQKRTSDPYKHDGVGVGDPSEGGNGVLIEVFDAEGAQTASLIAGRKNETIYVRDPDEAQAYRTVGSLPPFYNRRAWLDFNIVEIDQSAIRSVRLTDRFGQSVYLRRPPGSDNRSFRPAPPNETDRLISRLAASTTALAVTRLTALDVKPMDMLTSAPVANHISETFDGLEVNLNAYREPDGLWVTLRAIEAGEGARRAATINRKAEGWAFRLSEYDFQDFTPDIASLVER